MVKAKLYRQNHTKKHIHNSQKEKKEITYISLLPKSTSSILGWFIVYSGIPQMQSTWSWLWRFNPLLLRLLGEISLSLLCSHSYWGSALDLAPPLCIGLLRASVLLSDRMGLKEQLIQGLWLIQAGGREGFRCGASLQWQRPAWRCTGLRCAMCSPGDVVSVPWNPGMAGCAGSRRGCVDSDLCLHIGSLVAAAAALAFHARLWCLCW